MTTAQKLQPSVAHARDPTSVKLSLAALLRVVLPLTRGRRPRGIGVAPLCSQPIGDEITLGNMPVG